MPFGFNFNPLNLSNNSNNEEANARTRTTRRNENIITIEEGLKRLMTLKDGITKLFNILEGSEPNFTSDERIMLHTTVYSLCYSIPRYDRHLYNLYKHSCEEYITSKVLPSVQEKQGEHLLRELQERWSAYTIMTKRLIGVFHHVDKGLIRFGVPNLEETSFKSFYRMVYERNQEITHGQSIVIFDFFRNLQR